jgi:hypothetical protein
LRFGWPDDDADLRRWYRLYLRAMRHPGVVQRPYTFFAAMWRVLRPRGMMRPLIFAFNGRSEDALSLRPNDLLHWRAIQDVVAEGFRRYGLGEEGNEGLGRFKSKWGARPHQPHRIYTADSRHPDHSRAAGSLTDAVRTRVRPKLPLPVTAFAGRCVYRYL